MTPRPTIDAIAMQRGVRVVHLDDRRAAVAVVSDALGRSVAAEPDVYLAAALASLAGDLPPIRKDDAAEEAARTAKAAADERLDASLRAAYERLDEARRAFHEDAENAWREPLLASTAAAEERRSRRGSCGASLRQAATAEDRDKIVAGARADAARESEAAWQRPLATSQAAMFRADFAGCVAPADDE